MKAKYHVLLAWGVAVMMQTYPARGEEFYVSPHGNDADTGTIDHPFRTLEAARDAVRKLDRKGAVTVWLRGGIHERSSSFELTAQDSGTEAAPIIYRSFKGEKARLFGGKLIPPSAFEPVIDPHLVERLHPAARTNLLQMDLRRHGIVDTGAFTPRGTGFPNAPTPSEVFFNSQRLKIARWPNSEWLKVSGLPPAENLIGPGGKVRGKDTDRFFFSHDRMKQWKDTADLWVHGYWMYDWADAYLKVRSIDAEKGIVVLEPPQSFFGYRPNRRFRFLNLLEEIDEPGEFYVDRKRGILYLWPPQPIDSAEVHISLLGVPLISADNVSHVTFQNLGLECSRSRGVEIHGGTNVLVAGCEICRLGQDGVLIDGGREHTVSDCHIYDLGTTGVVAKGGDRQKLQPGRHSVINNHIHDIAVWKRTYEQGVRVLGVGHRVAHNHIHDAPHTAIHFKGNDHIIEFNHIHDVALETGDVGVIYTGRDWTMRGTVIRYNFIHDTVSRMAVGTMAVYLDDLASGIEISGNVFERAGKCVFIGGGRDNVVRNNVFIDSEVGVHIDNRGKGWAMGLIKGGKGSWDMFGKLRQVPYDRPPYTTKYPELVHFLDKDPLQATNNLITLNIKTGGGRFLDLAPDAERHTRVSDNTVE